MLLTGCAGSPMMPRNHVAQTPRYIHVEMKGDCIVAQQGRDEDSQIVSVTIWGSLRDPDHFEHGFRLLNDQETAQYIIVSRNEGTGPYYRLQIINFQLDGIMTWSYASSGKPRIEGKVIYLGSIKGGQYVGAGTEIEYRPFWFAREGLVPLKL